MTTTRKRGRPSAKTKTDRKELLTAALKAFAYHGYEGTNVKQLGEEAGIAPSLFYYHFKDKIGLWKAALELASKELGKVMAPLNSEGAAPNAQEFLKEWIAHFIRFSAKHPEFHQVISYEMARKSERADWLLKAILQPLHNNLQGHISTLQAAGLIKKMPFANIASVTIGAANIFFTQAYQMKEIYGIDVFDEGQISKHIDTVSSLFIPQHRVETAGCPWWLGT